MDAVGIACPPISLLAETGQLKSAVYDILDVAKHYNICIATSHISHEEAFCLARAAKERRFEKLLISHVLYPSTTYTLEEQQEFVRLGALLEYSYSTFTTKKTTYKATLAGIKAIGPQHCIISSDLGMPNGEYPDVGMLELSTMLYQDGISEDMIHVMNRDNPAFLVDG